MAWRLRQKSPYFFLITMSVSVFLAETLIMALFLVLPKFPDWVEIFMDSTLLSILIAPALYGLLYRPLVQEIAERSRVEQTLRRSQAQLKEQTEQLKDTLSKLQQTASLVQTEKMSSLRRLVAGIAHEINNPINFIHGNIKYVDSYARALLVVIQSYQRHYPDPQPELAALMAEHDIDFIVTDLPNVVASIQTGTERVCQTVLSLRNFSRLDEAAIKAINLHEGIDSALLLLQSRLKAKPDSAIQVVKDYSDLPLVECYVGQMNQVFMNLLVNAIDALDETVEKNASRFANDVLEGSTSSQAGHTTSEPAAIVPMIQIRTRLLPQDWVQISIQDNGVGVSDAIKAKIFDPLFTTKPVGKGTGLGLSISYQIVVEKHKGRLTCSTVSEGGTVFVIEIPRWLNRYQAANSTTLQRDFKGAD